MDEEKWNLVNKIHCLDNFGVRLLDSEDRGVFLQEVVSLLLGTKVKEKQVLDLILRQIKDDMGKKKVMDFEIS